jgi:hypothetical protein
MPSARPRIKDDFNKKRKRRPDISIRDDNGEDKRVYVNCEVYRQLSRITDILNQVNLDYILDVRFNDHPDHPKSVSMVIFPTDPEALRRWQLPPEDFDEMLDAFMEACSPADDVNDWNGVDPDVGRYAIVANSRNSVETKKKGRLGNYVSDMLERVHTLELVKLFVRGLFRDLNASNIIL